MKSFNLDTTVTVCGGTPQEPVNVSNSNDTYVVDTLVDLELPNINVTDSDGTVTSVPSMEDITCTPPSAIRVSNSDDSYDVNTLVDLELPNISFTDSDGITTSVPSVEDIVATACVIPPVDFTIDHSFLFDGVNETMTIPNAQIDNTIFGGATGRTYSINTLFKSNSSSGWQMLFGLFSGTNRTFVLRRRPTGEIELILATKKLISTETFLDTDWHMLTVVVDSDNSISNSYIMMDGVKLTNGTNTVTGVSTLYTNDYIIGTFGGAYANINLSFLSVTDRLQTEFESLDLYNSGQPKDPQLLFGSNCVALINADNSGSTAQFAITDSVNSVSASTVNMEDTDKTITTPYI